MLESRRLKIAPTLPDAAVLVRELETFQTKTTLTVDDALSWRDGPHDDLVLAVGVAVWLAERRRPVEVGVPFVHQSRAL